MAMKAATFQNWVLTTNLFHFCLSFKYYLFPEMINLALNALCIFGKVGRGGGGGCKMGEQDLEKWSLMWPFREGHLICYPVSINDL